MWKLNLVAVGLRLGSGVQAKGLQKWDRMSSLCFLENHIKDIYSVRPFVHVLTCLYLFNLSHLVKKENRPRVKYGSQKTKSVFLFGDINLVPQLKRD